TGGGKMANTILKWLGYLSLGLAVFIFGLSYFHSVVLFDHEAQRALRGMNLWQLNPMRWYWVEAYGAACVLLTGAVGGIARAALSNLPRRWVLQVLGPIIAVICVFQVMAAARIEDIYHATLGRWPGGYWSWEAILSLVTLAFLFLPPWLLSFSAYAPETKLSAFRRWRRHLNPLLTMALIIGVVMGGLWLLRHYAFLPWHPRALWELSVGGMWLYYMAVLTIGRAGAMLLRKG
ncbi:MAG: hypothetical protein QM667_02750, partial [Asticcacaulis sp.]